MIARSAADMAEILAALPWPLAASEALAAAREAIDAELARRAPAPAEIDGWAVADWRPRPGGELADFALVRGAEREEFEAVSIAPRGTAAALVWGVDQIARRQAFRDSAPISPGIVFVPAEPATGEEG